MADGTMNAEQTTASHAGIPLRVLIIEDSVTAMELLTCELRRVGYDPTVTRADTPEALSAALDRQPWDIILADYAMPDFSGLEALQMVRRKGLDVPFILVSGVIDETTAAAAMQAGAQDYLMKGRLTRLYPVVERELREARGRRERRRMETALREANHRIAESVAALQAYQLQDIQAEKMEAVGQLAAGITHELKNPLAILKMGLEYLSKHLGTAATPEVTMVVQDLRGALQRTETIIRGLLDFSKAKQLDLSTGNLNDVVESALSLAKYALFQLNVVKTLAPDLPPLQLDRQKIEQVFVNLILNASQAMPTGGTLSIRTHLKRLTEEECAAASPEGRFKSGETVAVAEVEDTGPGIPEKNLAKLFRPFFTTKPDGQGTGLGLMVTKKIVDLHFGMITIVNRQPHGARITIWLKTDQTRSLPAASA